MVVKRIFVRDAGGKGNWQLSQISVTAPICSNSLLQWESMDIKGGDMMEQKYFALNFALFCWVLALISWHLHIIFFTILIAVLSICGFIIHILTNHGNVMFNNNKFLNDISSTAKDGLSYDEKLQPNLKEGNTTIIAKNVCVEGDIQSDGQVHIFGKLKGNIEAPNSRIEIIREGFVEGDITSRELIVNGNLTGHCITNSLEIAENGKITGTISYSTLTIKKGGVFSGQAETRPDKDDIAEVPTTSLIASTAPCNTLILDEK